MDREPLNPKGMRMIADAVRDGASPPGVPYMLEDAAAEIEKIADLQTQLEQVTKERDRALATLADTITLNEELKDAADDLALDCASFQTHLPKNLRISVPDRARQIQDISTAAESVYAVWTGEIGKAKIELSDEQLYGAIEDLCSAVAALTNTDKDQEDG